MKRRSFLKTAAAATAATPFMLGGLPVRANTSLAGLAQMPPDNDRIMVVIQLFGGNDGLNTMPPCLDDEYYRIRPALAVAKDKAWNNIGDIYLHPALATGSQGGLGRMLEVGTLAIVQGVGYPNPNLSHFRSTDIWLSGINDSSPDTRLDTGWVGRYLEQRYPDFPASLPPDPLAIQFGGFSLALISSKGRMGIEVIDPTQLQGVASQLDELDPDSANTSYSLEYEFVADIANRSNKYAQAVRDAYNSGKAKLQATYADDSLSQQMASVAALIAGGLKTKVYVVSMGGFDTHVSQQIAVGDEYLGLHPTLLSRIGDSVAQFMFDMTRLGLADRVVGMTISEFGRRPYENGSRGTDHGAASVQFVFGTQVNSGVFGDPPDLKNLNANGDLQYQIDYRAVYAEILTDWFGLTMPEMRTVLQDDTVIPLDILQAQKSGTDRRAEYAERSFSIAGAYPNPFRGTTTLEISLDRTANVQLDVTTMAGERVATLLSRQMTPGNYRIPLAESLPAGTYLCTLRDGQRMATQVVQCVR